MQLVKIATRRRITVLMCTLAILLFGMVSLARLKVNLLPDLSYPTITIRTNLTGAAPLEIENLLSKPIEESVGIIKNVRQVRSISRSAQSDVILEFLWGTDMDFAGVDVREKLDLLDLPDEADRPRLLRFDPSNEPVLRFALVREQPEGQSTPAAISDRQLKYMRQLAEEQIKNSIEAVEGTAAVKVSGGLEDEIQILVDQQKIAQLGVSISEVSQRIRAENVNLSGGRLDEGSQRFLVRTINEFQSVESIGETVISSAGPQTVFLRDVATIRSGHKEREAVTRVDGRESVELAVYKEGDANTVRVAERIKQHVESVVETLPEDIEMVSVYDQSVFISDAINQVKMAALIGGLLAVFVLYFFLRDFRATLIIGVAIPVSVVGTFVAMYASDITLNIMSLGGIALAVGLLVDNSIVVLENIVRHREQGSGILEAADRGTSEVASAVIAATLTTVAVFFPMVFVSGIAGQLFRDQALTVTFALLFSLLVALTLIPMLAAWRGAPGFADSEDRRPAGGFTKLTALVVRFFGLIISAVGRLFGFVLRPFVWLFQGFNAAAARVYTPALAWSLKHRFVIVAMAALVLAGTLTLVPRLGAELIPQLSQGEFSVDVKLAPGTPLDATDRTMQRVTGESAAIGDLELSYAVAGTGNRLDANPVDSGENIGKLNIRLEPGAGRADEDAAMAAMRAGLQRIPGIQYKFSRPALFSFKTPLEIEIRGYDIDELKQVSDRIVLSMESDDRFADVKSTVELGNPEIQIRFDHEKAAKLGLVVRDIADRVVTKIRGDVATRYTLRDRKIDVLVRSIDTENASVDEIRDLIVNPQSDRPITLDAIANITMAMGPAEIRRIDQERVAVIDANLNYGDLGTAVASVEQLLAATPVPPGVNVAVAGQNAEMQESFKSMQFTLILAVFLVYLVMAAQFESIIHPFVILLTIPLALVGAVLALYLTGTTVNVVVFIGAIMLTGIVVNNAIVLVDLINQLRATGMERSHAIIEAGRARLRPILMTTTTTALGLTPMAIGFGDGAEVRAPMAITVIGGLIVSTLLTLLVIPVVYSLLDRKVYAPVEDGTGVAEVAS